MSDEKAQPEKPVVADGSGAAREAAPNAPVPASLGVGSALSLMWWQDSEAADRDEIER